jgi:predicted nicotinamide N-methyase
VAAGGAFADVVCETVELGTWTATIVRPRAAEALIDEESFARDEFLPYWAELWPSGLALARGVGRRSLAGVRVVELGCGLALPSLAAARAGGRVLASDWAVDALGFTRTNAARNGLALEVCHARWDEPGELARRGPFGLVLAADVLYEERNRDQLLGLLPALVAPGGEALVADPGRPYARGFLQAAARDWRVETLGDPLLPRGGIHRLWRD